MGFHGDWGRKESGEVKIEEKTDDSLFSRSSEWKAGFGRYVSFRGPKRHTTSWPVGSFSVLESVWVAEIRSLPGFPVWGPSRNHARPGLHRTLYRWGLEDRETATSNCPAQQDSPRNGDTR